MSSCVRKNWFSFAGQLLSLLASELTLFAWAGVSQEDFSNVTRGQWPVKDGPWRLQLRTDAEGCNICAVGSVFEYSGATIEFTNNLNRPIDINTAAGNYGSCTWPSATSTKVPPCLQGIAPGSRATIRLVEPAEPWGYNFKVEPEDATTGWTWFEISTGVGGQYDISFNKGYNVPLTVIAPDRQHVVTSKASPDAYPYRQPGTPETCTQVQPCYASSWAVVSATATYKVYIGNNPDDQDTPGRCGCEPCLGFPCQKGQDFCTTSQNETTATLYCWQGGHGDCRTLQQICPGATCPKNCRKGESMAHTSSGIFWLQLLPFLLFPKLL
jgi:hypothetical protein